MVTKWDVLEYRMHEHEAAAEALRAQLDGLDRTKFGHPCAGCGAELATEGDFARHFAIPDTRYLNLGYCPVEGPTGRRAS